MNINELNDLFKKRQSCRSFSNKPVSKETITKICDVARLSPSACNLQPWKIYAVTGKKREPLKHTLQYDNLNKFLDDAPAYLVIVQNIVDSPLCHEFAPNDNGILTAHIVLAAQALGVDSCIIGHRDEKEILKLLNLSSDYSIPLVIALGYSKENYEIRPKKRKNLNDILIFDE